MLNKKALDRFNPSIEKFPFGTLSSILVSKIIKISNFLLTCVAKNSNLFLMELIFKWAKINFFTLSLRIVLSVISRGLPWTNFVRTCFKISTGLFRSLVLQCSIMSTISSSIIISLISFSEFAILSYDILF